jgi:ATP-dependent RNA helicase SUPV3L1/SUV3
VTQRKNWVEDESHWRDETRAVEDRLSDALHAALTQRFVDRRTSVLLRRLKQKEALVAEVNDKGEVTVEGEFAGRLEGFRFKQDASATPDAARTLAQAALQALKPEFHLRADRFYNAPDTELDFTEQGGLMWGSNAVGKLVKGAEAAKPGVEAFVDDEAGPEVIEKVRRRLQHFIDRKVAAQFEPLLAMGRDEALTGLARGFAFRLSEAMGVLPRDAVASEVKELDQEARAALRKHGVRFGQFTIFLPALLKPAPTRLRLVLWSLWNGLQEFPESPPPGLVTIPNMAEVPKQHYTLAGYHPAGTRAIRIDMLERLADILRQKDSRTGFEATPDMLSITGMTLDQFADLMAGLGYKGEKSERVKVKAVEAPKAPAISEEAAASIAAGVPIPEEVSIMAPVPEPEAEPDAEAAPEMEAFYTFTWAPKPRFQRPERGPRPDRKPQAEGEARPQGDRPQGDRPQGDRPHGDRPHGDRPRSDRPKGDRPKGDRPKGDRPKGDRSKGDHKGKPPRDDRQKTYEARPPRAEKPIDPDNPFAALLALKGKV